MQYPGYFYVSFCFDFPRIASLTAACMIDLCEPMWLNPLDTWDGRGDPVRGFGFKTSNVG